MLLILVQVDGPKTRKGFASGCNRSQRMFCALLIDEHISMQHHGSLLAIYRSTNSEVLKLFTNLVPGIIYIYFFFHLRLNAACAAASLWNIEF